MNFYDDVLNIDSLENLKTNGWRLESIEKDMS